ncbi:hypothetical protein [Gephyromycinifex aptenodytis]|uniref:hypothetical protein n=1 Tax=Gephyromycinifex aptenodytis TaxID=2716227 RepID=UPI001446C91D|nr:hypothetical protein [Gephyromycinifex aptenodytis]
MSPVLVISLVLVAWLVIALVLGVWLRHWQPPVLATAALACWLLAMQQVWGVIDAGAPLPEADAVPMLGVVYLAGTAVLIVASVVAASRALGRRRSAR